MQHALSPKDCLELMRQTSHAFSIMEGHGIRIDVPYLDKAIAKTSEKIKEIDSVLRESDVYKIWKNKYGAETNLDSGSQLGEIFFSELGYESRSTTNTGQYSTKKDAFRHIDHPFITDYFKRKQCLKVKNTYLTGIKSEVIGDILRPSYNLSGGFGGEGAGGARTGRASASMPSANNFPIREGEMAEIIRTAFIPRNNHHIVEVDFSSIEVRISAVHHQDPKMLAYLAGHGDMHLDAAARVYLLDPKEVGKDIRYCGKNRFVFPQFYGSYYMGCAPALWESIYDMKLTTKSGIPLKDHLASKGITSLGDLNEKKEPKKGTFEKVVKDYETYFWQEQFTVYTEWKKTFYEEYLKRGYFYSPTGKVFNGIYRKNQVINYGTQCGASHCLFKVLILLLDEIRKRKMRSKVILPIHDSVIADVPESELYDYSEMVYRIMTKELAEQWKWISVPLEAELEICPLNASWNTKKKHTLIDGGLVAA